MDPSPLHPFFVHLPLALAVVIPLLSLGILIAWWRDWLPGRAWAIAVAFQLLLAGAAFAAVQTGEVDEEHVEEILVDEDPLEVHEERGESFFWATLVGLALMAAPMLIPGQKRKKGVAAVATLATVGVAALAVAVGESGGELVYEHGAASAYSAGASGADSAPEDHDDDHDDDD